MVRFSHGNGVFYFDIDSTGKVTNTMKSFHEVDVSIASYGDTGTLTFNTNALSIKVGCYASDYNIYFATGTMNGETYLLPSLIYIRLRLSIISI